MRRFVVFLILWAGLLGAGSPAFACATAAAAGDCCPPGAPAGCTQVYEQFDIEANACCIAAVAPAQIVTTEFIREQLGQRDDGSADSVAFAAMLSALTKLRGPGPFTERCSVSAFTDASLTYLHTGRLRL